MRKLLSSVLLLLSLQESTAQVAISNPASVADPSAMLEIKSTTKGFLLPRMSNLNKQSIANPAEGLLVYDTDNERIYVYRNGWKALIDNTSWSNPVSHNWVYNVSDSIGIGTSLPTEKLDVNGTIRARNRIEADGVIESHGLSSLGSFYVSGNSLLAGSLTGNSTASFSGNVNSNASMSITDAAGILQFKNGSADKGFVQLSGDDLRIGTNSSNTNGTLIIRTSGADQLAVDGTAGATFFRLYNDGVLNANMIASSENLSINTVATDSKLILNNEVYVDITNSRTGFGTANPEQRVHVAGNIKLTNGRVLNNDNLGLTPIAWAKFTSTGSKVAGTTNIAATAKTASNGVKYFAITMGSVNLANACPVITPSRTGHPSFHESYNGGDFAVFIYGTSEGEMIHAGFSIVIYN